MDDNRRRWLTFTAAILGWLFDGFEMSLFPLLARPAIRDLLRATDDGVVGEWMGWITAAFLVGAALGGALFGWLGDRIGRVRAMTLSILTYSLVSGIAYFAQAPIHLAALRFLAALGMGGEWALGVALVMETWPEARRPWLAGAIGAAANLGTVLASLIAYRWPITESSWRWMFLVGASPAILTLFVRLFVPESERWRGAVERAASRPIPEILDSPELTKRTVIGIVLASVALVGTWGSVQWIPLWTDQLTGKNPSAKALAHMLSGLGAVGGSLLAPVLFGRMPRRFTYFLLCLAALGTCCFYYRSGLGYGALFLAVTVAVGMSTAAFYGFFPLYFPELFPTRVRATGQGLCFNSGRVIAAVGAVTSGQLVTHYGGDYAKASAALTLVYAIGLAAIWFAPETKGRPLPE